MIYLRHPDHGVKAALLEAEAAADEANGWERFDFYAEERERRFPQAAEQESEEPKRRGRPRKEQ